ncbi:iron-siderophore ABC transporter substrate-binding protein [Streptomyces sp. 4N509B]|uniref:iron-siderophore ABC transporter substrate-binding protein n=1 Tax=Streptomyces sp. 4N509B TaxID=3457413 RepID=UPI003FD1749D
MLRHRPAPRSRARARARSRVTTAATVAVSAALLLGTVAGCGRPDDGDSDGGQGAAGGGNGGGSTSVEPDAFPVTIEHRYGSTTIDEEPQRIVTVGLTDQDAVLALGKVPVGVTDWLGMHDGAIGPWAEEALGDAERPTLLTDTGTGPQLEEITLLNPDLIIALYDDLTREEYDNLSEIADVVAAPEEFDAWAIPWQDQTRIVGQALGRSEEAEQLVTEVEEDFAAVRAEHPEFEESTAVVATPYEGFFVYGSRDPRSRLLTDLGFSLPEELDAAIGDDFGASISRERTDLLDQSAALWIVADPEADAEALHDDGIYGDLAVVSEGREVFVDETSGYGAAFSFGTVLALPYVVDRLVPQLDTAIDGDPSTVVAPPAE